MKVINIDLIILINCLNLNQIKKSLYKKEFYFINILLFYNK